MNVLLATDASEQAERAKRLVASIAWPDATHVEVLYVDQTTTSEAGLPAAAYTPLHEHARRRIEAHLARASRALEAPGRQVEATVVPGRPASVIVAEAWRMTADVVVIGSHGHGTVESVVLGSVSAEVVDHAPCSVLVARRATLASVVLATDGSGGARQAEELVASWPFLAALPVRVVSVATTLSTFPTLDPLSPSASPPEICQQLSEEVRAAHERIAKESVERLVTRHVNARAMLREGYAPNEIVRDAANAAADLIVIGARGRSSVPGLPLGGVARRVLFQAPCSVLVVRSRPAG